MVKNGELCSKCRLPHGECPSEAEIEADCRDIQRPWSRSERYKRAGLNLPVVEVQEAKEGFRTPLGRVLIPAATLLAVWLACSPAFAQGPPVWGQQPAWRSPGFNDGACGPQSGPPDQSQSAARRPEWAAVVKVDVTTAERQGNGVVHNMGSGTVIERWENGNGLIVTNSHVVNGRESDSSVVVDFVQIGYKAKGVVVLDDPTWDVAAIVTLLPANVQPVPLRETLVELGETLTTAGYPQGGNRISIASGRASQYNSPRGRSSEAYMLTVDGAASYQGCSGGAIIDSKGRLAAVLWGGERSFTAGTVCARILQRLRNLRDLLAGKWAPGGRGKGGGVSLDPIQGKPPQPPVDIVDLPPAPGRPNQSPISPPAEPAPPSNDSTPSGPGAGGELATILEGIEGRIGKRISDLEGKIKDKAEGAAGSPIGGSPIGSALADEGKQLAEDAVESAAPSILSGIADKLLPLILKTLGITLGGATGLGGVGLAGWGAIKLIKGIGGMLGGVLARRRTARTAAKTAAQQGSNGGRTDSPGATGTDAHVFNSPAAGSPAFDPQAIVASEVSRLAQALKNDLQSSLQSSLDAKLSIIGQQAKATAEIVAAKPDPAPQFVPTQVDNPQLIALEKALETFGGQTPANAKWVNLIYSFRDQLLNRAKAA